MATKIPKYIINNSKMDFEITKRDKYFNLNLNVGSIKNNSREVPIKINNSNNNQINKENDFQINKTIN